MLRVRITGDLKKIGREEAARLARDVSAAIVIVGREVQAELRAQTTAARLGRGVANAWRLRFYRSRRAPVAFVYSRAPNIIAAFDEGARIRAHGNPYLAIPTGFNRQGGRRGAKVLITPEEMARTRGTFVKRSKKGSLLWFLPVSSASRISYRGGRVTRSRTREAVLNLGQGQKFIRSRNSREAALAAGAVPMFVLKREVKLGKRLDIDRAVESAAARLEAEIGRDQ